MPQLKIYGVNVAFTAVAESQNTAWLRVKEHILGKNLMYEEVTEPVELIGVTMDDLDPHNTLGLD